MESKREPLSEDAKGKGGRKRGINEGKEERKKMANSKRVREKKIMNVDVNEGGKEDEKKRGGGEGSKQEIPKKGE